MNNDAIVDVAIIGGGISGLGVAIEAVNKGLSTALLEKNKLSEATSKSSLRIIHGGFRYLQNMDLPRVVESVKDQSYILNAYKEHMQILPCVLPVKKFGLKSALPLTIAAFMYNQISKICTGKPGAAKVLPLSKLKKTIKLFEDQSQKVLYWEDVLLKDPIAFATQLKNDLESKGAYFFEGTEVVDIRKEKDYFSIVINYNGELQQLKARKVVNTSGPWLHRIRKTFKSNNPNLPYGWCKAINLILKKQFEDTYGVGIFGTNGRSFFLVPRDKVSVLGTWYLPFDGDPSSAKVEKIEIEGFLNAFNSSSNIKITYEDVDSAEIGILPHRGIKTEGDVKLYGLEKISCRSNYIEVMSTKYTTFVSQGRKVGKFL